MTGAGAMLDGLFVHWGDAMLRASWQGGVALLLAYALQRLLPRLRADLRCWIWRLAFAKLLLALFWADPIPLPVLRAASPSPQPAGVASKAASTSTVAAAHTSAAHPSETTVSPSAPPAARERFVSRVRPFALPSLFGLWLLGAGWCLIRLAGEWSAAEWLRGLAEPVRDAELMKRFWRLCERFGVEAEPRLLVTPGAGSPVLLGVRQPSVVLTTDLLDDFTADELDLMLAHEVGHLRRKDLPWGWLAAAGQALFFFHPLVRLAGAEWKTAQEMACDELTVRVTGAAPGDYGQVLVKVAAQSRPSLQSRLATAGVLESAQALKARLAAMKTISRRSRGGTHVAVLVALLGVMGLLPWKLVPRTARQSATSTPEPLPPASNFPAAKTGSMVVLPSAEATPLPSAVLPPSFAPSPGGPPAEIIPPPPVEPPYAGHIRKGMAPWTLRGLGTSPENLGRPRIAIAPSNRIPSAPVPASAAAGFAPQQNKAVVDAALQDLSIGVPTKRSWALDRLAGARPDRPREPVAAVIEPLLEDRELFTRAAAARALAVWARPQSLPVLVARLDDPEHAVRWAVLDTLGKLHDARAAAPLARMLKSNDRGFASRALQELGPSAAAAVAPYLTDEEWTVRLEACRVLKGNGGPAQLPALRSALHDSNSIVARAAEDALKSITSGRQ